MSTTTMTGQLSAHEELRARVERLTVTARSPDGDVVITVKPPGVLAGLTLSEAALRRGATDLAQLIVATAGRGQARLARRLSEQTRRHLEGRHLLLVRTGAAR
jgi:hypothetical protein